MTYPVELTDRAARDLNSLYVEERAEESIAAARWYNRLETAVNAYTGPLPAPAQFRTQRDQSEPAKTRP